MLKKRFKNKLIPLLLTITMVLVLLAGCAQPTAAPEEAAPAVEEPSAEESVAEEPAEEEPVPEEPTGPVDLVFWTNLTVPVQSEVIQAQVNECLAEMPNVSVDFETVPFRNMYVRLLTSKENDDMPNIMNTTPDGVSFAQNIGALVPVDELIETIGKDDFYENYLNMVSKDDQIWAMPDWALHREIWYRKDVFDENGFSVPESQAEMMEIAKALTQDTDGDGKTDVYGYVVPMYRHYNAMQTFLQLFYAAGGFIHDPETGEYVFDEYQDLATDTLQYMVEMYDCCSPPASIDWRWGDYRNAFAEGLVMMVQGNGAVANVIKDANPDIADDISAFETPGLDGPGNSHWEGGYTFMVGTAPEAEIQASKDLLECMSDPKKVADRVNSRPVFALPARRSVFESDYYQSYEMVQKYADELAMVFNDVMPKTHNYASEHAMTSLTGQMGSSTFFGDLVQAVALGQMEAADAIAQIDSQLKYMKVITGE